MVKALSGGGITERVFQFITSSGMLDPDPKGGYTRFFVSTPGLAVKRGKSLDEVSRPHVNCPCSLTIKTVRSTRSFRSVLTSLPRAQTLR